MHVVTKIKNIFVDKLSLSSVRIPADEQLKLIDYHISCSYKLRRHVTIEIVMS